MMFEAASPLCPRFVLRFNGLSYFHAPFILKLRDSQHGSAHHGDNDSGDYAENAFPEILCFGKYILSEAIERSDHSSPDDDYYEYAETNSEPDLAAKVNG